MTIYILKACKGSYEDYSTWDIMAYTSLVKAEAEKSNLECVQKDEIIEAEEYINNNKNHDCVLIEDRYGNDTCEICEKIEESECYIMDSDEMVGYYIRELELDGVIE